MSSWPISGPATKVLGPEIDCNGTSTAASLAGPPLGLAASWTRSSDPWRRGAGIGVIPGVLVGEALHGLVRVADTTSPGYWTVELVLGVVVLAVAAARGRRVAVVLAAMAVTATVAAVVFAVGGSGVSGG